MNILKQIFPFLFGKPVVKVLTMTEILNETVDVYATNPLLRSSHNNQCYFNGPDGTHCVVGRCLLPQYQGLGDKLAGNKASVTALLRFNNIEQLDEMLAPQYRGHSIIFWVDLQVLHDNDKFWTVYGLSEEGVGKVDSIKYKIETGFYCPTSNNCN